MTVVPAQREFHAQWVAARERMGLTVAKRNAQAQAKPPGPTPAEIRAAIEVNRKAAEKALVERLKKLPAGYLMTENGREIIQVSSAAFNSKPKLFVRDVITKVAQKDGLLYGDLASPRRAANLVASRQEAMWLAWVMFPLISYPALGVQFGGRDHTTVLHGVRKVCARRGLPHHRPSCVEQAREFAAQCGIDWPEGAE